MRSTSRRSLMAGAALGIASSLLPSAAAAASGDEDEQTPTVAFAPAYRIFNTGVDPNFTVQVQMGVGHGVLDRGQFPERRQWDA